MLASVPDTPYGHAFGRFLLLFTHSPLDLTEAHSAFADLSALAASEHPKLPWPLVMRQENGPPLVLTVEGLLAHKRAKYAEFLVADDAAVEAALGSWAGATVRSVQASRSTLRDQTSSVLLVEVKTPAGYLARLKVHCPWHLVPARAGPGHWNDGDNAPEHGVARLRRAQVHRVSVQPGGALLLAFANGTRLLVGSAGWEPNEYVADLHYYVEMKDRLFWRVATEFRVQPLP